jgi:hypothetical protein
MRLRHYILILFSLTFLTYVTSFGNQFVWDDEQFIYKNAYVTTFDLQRIFTESTTSGAGIGSDYYRPITTLSFAIDANLWGLHPLPFHLTNTTLHASAGIFIFLLLLQVGLNRKVSFLISAVFLTHPLQTEAVTYINSRGDSLYTFFGMLSCLLFTLLVRNKKYELNLYNLQLTFSKTLISILVVLFYAFSILSKEIGIAVVGIVLLLYFQKYLTGHTKNIFEFSSKNLAATITVLSSMAVSISYLILRGTVLNFTNSFNLYNDGSLYSENVFVRLLTFSKVLWIYIKLLFIPFPLHMERTVELVTTPVSIWPLLTFLLLIFICISGFREYKKNKSVYVFFGAAWFFGMLTPVSGILPINGILYEHWLYLPLVGFCCMLYGLSRLYLPKIGKDFFSSHYIFIVSVIILSTAILTIRQNYFWSTPIRLYEYLLEHTSSARIYSNLGMAYGEAGNTPKAIENYKKAIEINDSYPQTFHNLANSYRDSGQNSLAIENYQKALAIQPDFYFSYASLINLLVIEKRYNEALTTVNQVKVYWPNDPMMYVYEIYIYANSGDLEQAEKTLKDLELKYSSETQIISTARQLLNDSQKQ